MVPDKFDMVDMEGIDLIESQGVAVPGLHEKLVESITLCRYQCLYNWKFNGILIPPTYVEMVATDEEVSINGGVTVDVDDVIHISSIEPAPILPVIETLQVTENGMYQVSEGVDGFNPVSVSVPGIIILDREPTVEDGAVGEYCLSAVKPTFDAIGVEILVAARDTNYSFGYYGTSALRLSLKDSEDNIVSVTDLSNAHFYVTSTNMAVGVDATPALTSSPSGTYYERNGLPGYFKIIANDIGEYTPLSLGFCRRYGVYNDFISTFNIILIENNVKVGVLKSIANLTLNDWPAGEIVTFSDFEVPLVKKLYYKTELGWVQIL